MEQLELQFYRAFFMYKQFGPVIVCPIVSIEEEEGFVTVVCKHPIGQQTQRLLPEEAKQLIVYR